MKKPIIIAGGVAVLAVAAVSVLVGVWLLRSDDPNLLTEAPAIPTSASGGADVSPTTAAAVNLPAGVRRFVVASGESSVKFVVEETLRGLDATAVGTTTAITGELYLTKEGLYSGAPSTFKVDLRTLKTDESRRDDAIKDRTLNTSRYPFAEFVVERVTGFPTNYTEGLEIDLTLSGTMKIRDTTRPVSFVVKARQLGSSLTAIADTDFKMSDFGLTPPEFPGFAKARDPVHLQIVLVAREA